MALLSTLSDSSLCASLLSWKTLAVLFAFINRKSLPLAWTVGIWYNVFRRYRRDATKFTFECNNKPLNLKGRATHPVFAAATVTSYTSLLETDYNLHKSNSTYFADMDISRTACVTPLYTPGAGIVSKELDEEIAAAAVAEGKPRPKKTLPMYIALGGTYCTFKREIKPLERFQLKSHVAAWDEKWMYIITYFLKAEKKKGEGPVLAAIGLSKYCFKKGRLTVPIERVLRASGYLPERPDAAAVTAGSEKDISSTATPGTQDGLIDTTLDEVKLVEEVSKLGDHAPEVLHKQQKENAAAWTEEEWSWERIEEQRKKGLEMVHGFISLDNMLFEEWKSG
ncbi:hypothetical protein UA08_08876 [Talaromyces atroroseus]|uniref:Uncharacterized protein n=1 Tax=Talaromyces atroroseus TaxID=1441469 RepID=A0A225ACZ9_TALAT|nr:hypothetical protein UA08_08876 [Talaromyces atroroseus]OKL55784.1 hypothetical protein UA08_08876 [Talaromyces atroroseus]